MMDYFRRRAALSGAMDPVARTGAYSCEPLERRMLLDANDPVLVLVEPFSLTTWPTVTSETVYPKLWKNSREFLWDLDLGNWNTEDGDENGLPDDAYGWNFTDNPPNGSPNIILESPGGDHGATIVKSVLDVLDDAGSQGDRVKIMFVIGGGGLQSNAGVNSPALQYILDRKQSDTANIVAVGTLASYANRAGAEELNDAEIMLIGGVTNSPLNFDSEKGNTSEAFLSATPRSGVQAPALDNVIPVTTDPSVALTAHGINSFYSGMAGFAEQSFAGPAAAAMAAVAVQAYQDAHNGDNPTVEQIKRGMMSGVTYASSLNHKTITHDYDGMRKDGGFFNLGGIIGAINQMTPEIANVSMTKIGDDQLGTEVDFSLTSTAEPTNWTISWGDNSGSDGSGVEVAPGSADLAEHRFPFENVPHRYFPTIYAMSGTKQVYLQTDQEEVVNEKWAPTSGQDNYTLARSGSSVTLTLQNTSTTSATFAPSQMPTCLMTLGAGSNGADTLTIDFTNGNPLESMVLTVNGTFGAGNVVRIIGSAGADTISVIESTVTVNGRQFPLAANFDLYVDGAGGADILNVIGNERKGPRVYIDQSQSYSQINVSDYGGIVMDPNGALVLRTQVLSVESDGFIDLANNHMIVDYTGPSPLEDIEALLTSGYAAGAWNGAGIQTSEGDPTTYALGFAEASDLTTVPAIFGTVDSTTVLIRYTYYGDTDLTGGVGLADFNRLAASFGTSGHRWFEGDLNFDTNVNLIDFDLLAGNFGAGGGTSPLGGGPDETFGYTTEELLEHLINGGHGINPP